MSQYERLSDATDGQENSFQKNAPPEVSA